MNLPILEEVLGVEVEPPVRDLLEVTETMIATILPNTFLL